jgi:histidinol phosphatase-like PHP family hydrolase
MTTRAQRVDLHVHTFFSDGALLPSELIQRATAVGHRALAITDHADSSNLEPLAEWLLRFVEEQGDDWPCRIVPGVELTHVVPGRVGVLAERAKELGLPLVVVHGETPVEPVAPGTNEAAVECPHVDILAHPGFVTLREAKTAAQNGVHLELSARHGHCLANGHVAWVARQTEARLLVNTDAHSPSELIDQTFARRVAAGAGLTQVEVEMATVTNPSALLARVLQRLIGSGVPQPSILVEGD